MRIAAVTTAVLFAASAVADDTAAEVAKRQREQEVAQLKKTIEMKKLELAAVTKAKPDKNYQGQGPSFSGPAGEPTKITFHYFHPKDKEEMLAKLKKAIVDAEAELEAPMTWLDPDSLAVGQEGQIGARPVGLFWLKVRQVLDEKTMVVSTAGGNMRPFIVRGPSTKDRADDEEIQLKGTWKVTGTEKRGTRTLFVVEPVKKKD